jgi:hypothetical protein
MFYFGRCSYTRVVYGVCRFRVSGIIGIDTGIWKRSDLEVKLENQSGLNNLSFTLYIKIYVLLFTEI